MMTKNGIHPLSPAPSTSESHFQKTFSIRLVEGGLNRPSFLGRISYRDIFGWWRSRGHGPIHGLRLDTKRTPEIKQNKKLDRKGRKKEKQKKIAPFFGVDPCIKLEIGFNKAEAQDKKKVFPMRLATSIIVMCCCCCVVFCSGATVFFAEEPSELFAAESQERHLLLRSWLTGNHSYCA
ncbi:hypothetical protein L873DRAFT_933183 [Choiromyces venosus 120613-1]|uniref:Uncharacterized protein n=1 Tax=Choiromyces venosus 120613-1 TaxID=1336337 RepID=A0A3N4JQT5_9PEZI|nr:hypothetical protein L873DRAFT_933183 [Choiromyces venosus 120613-1]